MDAPESPWGTSPYQQAVAEGSHNSWLRWVVVAAAAVVVVGGGIGGYLYLHRAVPLPVTVSIEGQPLVPGSSSELLVTVTNASPTDTALAAEVAVTLPEKTISAGLDNETASSSVLVPTVSVGDIVPGASAVVRLMLSTELDPSSAVPVSVVVSYATPRDPTKRFEASAGSELVVREPAVTLSIEAPPAVVRAAPFSATLRYRNNTDKPITGAELALALPRGLVIASSTPVLAGTRLALGPVASKQGGMLVLSLLPGPSAPHEMPIRGEITAAGTTLAERTASVIISSDALAVSALINGREEDAIDLGQTVSYEIVVSNLAKVPLKDVQVKARLASPLFMLSTVQAQYGALSAKEPVMTWTGVGVPGLRDIEPGDSVSLRLAVRFAKSAGTATAITAPLVVTATSPTVPAGTSAAGVTANDTALAKLAADVAFGADAYWRDPLGQVGNAGPQPPRVGVATQYLIRWAVRPANAGIKDAIVSASLAPGVRFTGKLGGVTASALTYDVNTGQVTWHPGVVAANATVRAAFQVEITPAENQIGRTARLMDASTLTATDAFTGVAVRESSPALTTNLSGSGVGQGDGVVE